MNFNHLKQRNFLILIVIVLFAPLSRSIIAQSGTTSVSGTVLDRRGQVIFGATVTLTNAEKGFTRTATTDDNGTFNFPVIQPGIYRLEVEMNGFKKFASSEVRASVDTPTEISAVLEIGNVSETVNVRSDTAEALLNTQDATIGSPFNSTQVTQLPTEARDIINLLTLQPGVTRFGYVAGGRSDQANITLDGVAVNEAITNDIFSPILRLNAEAIEEFRVTTTNANASQGRSSGAQISLVTRGGTNNARGAIFLTGRRTGWTANDFFNNRAGVERPKLDRNVFGGAIGGPIWKNRAFFFYSYEGERSTRGATVVRVVPLPTLGQGIVRFRNTNGQISSLDCSQITAVFPNTEGCNPATLAVFAAAAARYPANSFDAGDSTADALMNTAGFRFNADNKIKNNSHVLKLDFNFSAKQQAFFRFNYINDFETSAAQFPDTPAPSVWKHPVGFVVGHNWTISKNIFNNFRYGLTRNSFSSVGDSTDTAISFTGVYSPLLFQRTFSPIDSVNNITDDVSLIWRNHIFQFGTNIRLIRSRLHAFARAYDSAAVNSALFLGGANSVSSPINSYLQNAFGYQIAESNVRSVQDAAAAVIGRFSTYSATFTFQRDGSLQPAGTPAERDFRSQEYDFYIQDIWKFSANLTITAGLRYGLSRPVYEANGYEVKPNINLSEYFESRAAGAANGTPYNQPIVLDFSGTANGKSPLYKWDKNNFQPRFAVAWSPNFGKNRLGWLFGRNNESVLRGGFAVTNDHLAVVIASRYDNLNTLGFTSSSRVQNRYNLTNIIAPSLFTGFNQNIRNLRDLTLPAGNLTFPRQALIQNSPTAIEYSIDENLSAPINYSWNLTFERILPAGLIVSVSYLGRKARNLLQARDAAAIANFVDTQSGTDWNTAATQLEILRQQGIPISQISQIPYFANLFPSNLSAALGCPGGYNQTQAVYSLAFTGAGSCGTNYDWTNVQLRLSRLSSRFPGQHIFYQPQYATYRAWSSIGKSDYQGLTFSVRQRLGTRLTMDFNYTFSKSSDDGSGLQSNLTNPTAAIINPFRQEDAYAASDFDMRHIVNANAIFKLPIGRGEMLFGNINKFTNLILGGWQLAGIFRYNSGLPISAPFDAGRATSGSVQSYTTRTADIQTCPTRGGGLFGCNTPKAYRSFRNAYPGETGERNVFRLPGYWVVDIGFGKTFNLPWENHQFQFRWEVFNVANTQKMGSINSADYTVGLDPQNAALTPTNFANFTAIQGFPRSMQFVLRYSF
ncbi:MAG: carboxypeptidase regulatory-like domain-containing protein [Pyrinomonadaceae bacterium]